MVVSHEARDCRNLKFTSDGAAPALESATRATRRARASLLALVGICAAIAPTDSATARGIAWTDCGKRLQCARVPVPLDWDHPRGPRIRLAVIRHPASHPGKRDGSLFVNPGGPGESGVDLVRNAGADLDAMGRGRFDVVSWDPRGTNASAHVRCFENQRNLERFWSSETIPITKPQSRRFRRKTAALARRCGEVSGTLLRHISTADTARDLDYLRRALGERRLTYMGFSYGTFLGQTYANLFPRRVRAMLLDGVVDPVAWTWGAEARAANTVAPTDGVFDRFLALCQRAGPAACALAGNGPVAVRVRRLFDRVRRNPIPAPAADPPGELTYADLLLALFAPIRDPAQWPRLAEKATNTVLHNAKNPSRLVVGAVPKARAHAPLPGCDTLRNQPCRPDPLAG